ncbi:sedoheptulose-1,7-bisphosphatase [Paraphaeosphaeria sporulosa]|uniref:Sedoheptulose-1,7-bisphosphatase n=1 Tax=Paraphaeosphaeria sporulosa TaxID=1460663 RepID=A0A177CHD3_9PLEO|nr:sedoheptulose-1,7-bisphosphatase [Paraphaeosphaeria sporulosa]OAG06736.1 sedoheptulose-1,7-bisphosphatase [Paraphaeosphaeria sporulosa]
MPSPQTLTSFLSQNLPQKSRAQLRTSVLPTLLTSITRVAQCLRESQDIQAAGSQNTSGDTQLNVDLATNEIVHAAVRTCPSIISASSEEDEGENAVQHDAGVQPHQEGEEQYAVAFDPLDGSSIIPANWSVGTIIGIWDGTSALHQPARKKQIAAILGVLGPRTTAIVAIHLPELGSPLCFEVGLSSSTADILVIRESVSYLTPEAIKTRYFAPANLRAAAQDPRYKALIDHFIEKEYTLRYSGGLVPDIYHSLIKGHGVYVSPVTSKSHAKLRLLYEVAPIALIIECAGGRAADPASGEDILAKSVGDVDQRSGLICGTLEEVLMCIEMLV